jgi:hypothetical protein
MKRGRDSCAKSIGGAATISRNSGISHLRDNRIS